jgi:broad specificity phosphatase PhoE
MTRIFLLRHGATAFNRRTPYRLQGRRTDGPLDSLGISQARRAAAALSEIRIDAVYASPLARAIETARLVAEPSGREPTAVADLIEAELGRWEGLTWQEASERDPERYERFMAEPGVVPYPEGESFLDVQGRVAPAIAAIADRHPSADVVVVGHNVVNRAYLALPLGLPINRARGIRQSNGGINIVEYENGQPVVVCLNGCLHLVGLGH